MTLEPRPLVSKDIPRLVELESVLFGDGAWSRWMIREELTGPSRFYIGLDETATDGATEGGAIEDRAAGSPLLVGYAGTWSDGIDAQVMTIGVAPSHQGRGLGRLLLAALLEHERERGTQQLFLEVRVDNELAIGMYERAGFERLGVRRGYYQPENIDALTMRLVVRGN